MLRYIQKSLFLLTIACFLNACASHTAFEKQQEQADAGHAENQLLLGDRYLFGTEALPQDKDMALKYYRLAADAGNSTAAFNLGVIYQQDGLYEESFHYYELASSMNNANAQDNLAILYQNGIGVEQDLNKAEELYLQALSNGSKYSKRNLAILYRDSKQTDKAINMFQTLLFDPTTQDNSYKFKKAVAYELMKLYLLQDDKNRAYVWGSVAVLSGLFDSNITNSKEKLAHYDMLTHQLSTEEKTALVPAILNNHFKGFQHYETEISQRENFLVMESFIALPTEEMKRFTTYKIHTKESIYNAIELHKNKEDKKSRINFALHTLRLAAYNISVGAIYPHFHMAKSNIENSLTILNEYNDRRFEPLKANTKLKLQLVKAISNYQEKRRAQ